MATAFANLQWEEVHQELKKSPIFTTWAVRQAKVDWRIKKPPRDEILAWWNLARPRPVRPRFPDVPLFQVERAVLEDLVSSVTAMRDAYHPEKPLVILW